MGTGDHNAGGGGVTLQWTSIPFRGGSNNIPSHFMLQKPELSAGLMGLLARIQTLLTHLNLPWTRVGLSGSKGYLTMWDEYLCPWVSHRMAADISLLALGSVSFTQ